MLAFGGIGSAIGTGGIALVSLGVASTLVQGYVSYKKLDIKIPDCCYVYQSYQHILNQIKDALGYGNFEVDNMHNQMRSKDDFATDIAPPIDGFLRKYDKKFNDQP